MSSNIKRTVQSAQSVVAGLYSKEQLNDYATICGPVKIYIPDPNYNLLIPDTEDCDVLKKNNISTLVHTDRLPGFKDQRLEVEAHIMKFREKLLEAVAEVQARIDSMLDFYKNEGARTHVLEINRHRQHYQYDPILQPLYEERGRAIAKVERFWASVVSFKTSSDMRFQVLIFAADFWRLWRLFNSGRGKFAIVTVNSLCVLKSVFKQNLNWIYTVCVCLSTPL
ncbi:hypothetical protein PoB_006825600 [Plakobranchus ocellatus]|uniref:Uncharacterized protein n=1 Tax=Plakobranchus ocellatus TaxID=259542 RepID=A0AAV4DCF3_9GAST|nr:hypothetical protein PoB_006825600 [Plakobranchus ocellatus]